MNTNALKGMLRKEMRDAEEMLDGGASERAFRKVLEWVNYRMLCESDMRAARLWAAAERDGELEPGDYDMGLPGCQGASGFGYTFTGNDYDFKMNACEASKCLFRGKYSNYCAANGKACVSACLKAAGEEED